MSYKDVIGLQLKCLHQTISSMLLKGISADHNEIINWATSYCVKGPQPVAEGMMDLAASTAQRVANNLKEGKVPASADDFLTGMLINEPTLDVKDPFLLHGNEYPGTPQYILDVDVSKTSEKTIQELVDKVQPVTPAEAETEPALEGAALRLRNMFWYNRSLSPKEFPLKPGQWKK
eukprot:scaffold95475_cov30-Prasinocladus_malaysianus.AAC.2